MNQLLSLNPAPDWLFLYTAASVLPVSRFSLQEWSDAVSLAAGRRVLLPSYRALHRYLSARILTEFGH